MALVFFYCVQTGLFYYMRRSGYKPYPYFIVFLTRTGTFYPCDLLFQTNTHLFCLLSSMVLLLVVFEIMPIGSESGMQGDDHEGLLGSTDPNNSGSKEDVATPPPRASREQQVCEMGGDASRESSDETATAPRKNMQRKKQFPIAKKPLLQRGPKELLDHGERRRMLELAAQGETNTTFKQMRQLSTYFHYPLRYLGPRSTPAVPVGSLPGGTKNGSTASKTSNSTNSSASTSSSTSTDEKATLTPRRVNFKAQLYLARLWMLAALFFAPSGCSLSGFLEVHNFTCALALIFGVFFVVGTTIFYQRYLFHAKKRIWRLRKEVVRRHIEAAVTSTEEQTSTEVNGDAITTSGRGTAGASRRESRIKRTNNDDVAVEIRTNGTKRRSRSCSISSRTSSSSSLSRNRRCVALRRVVDSESGSSASEDEKSVVVAEDGRLQCKTTTNGPKNHADEVFAGGERKSRGSTTVTTSRGTRTSNSRSSTSARRMGQAALPEASRSSISRRTSALDSDINSNIVVLLYNTLTAHVNTQGNPSYWQVARCLGSVICLTAVATFGILARRTGVLEFEESMLREFFSIVEYVIIFGTNFFLLVCTTEFLYNMRIGILVD
ncbi:unnamed protein product [Amoebophrya sp. A25]|nr:unnamed protein product [Amoebophrya sp. A25]|eukprot:GSA25T00024785001.1